jgi:hypothetical protein
VLHTNRHAKQHEKEPHERPWVDITRADFYAFIGILCYDAVHRATDWRDYWNQSPGTRLHPAVSGAMSLNRFREIQRWFCITDPTTSNDHKLLFESLEPLNNHLLEVFKELWNCGENVAVDEAAYC